MFRDLYEDVHPYAAEPVEYLDVPFVPTEEPVIQAMLSLAGVGSKDVLFDLGSGDGRILIAAARDRDARGIGVEIDPVRIADAMEEAGWAGVERLVDFIEEDIFSVDFSAASVVTLYLLASVNLDLRPRLLSELRPGTRIVSHAFDMGDWKPDDWRQLDEVKIYKWVVPAQVAGVWQWDGPDGEPCRVELHQTFQDVDGMAWISGHKAHLDGARLQGNRLDLILREDQAVSGKSFTLRFRDNKLHSVAPGGTT